MPEEMGRDTATATDEDVMTIDQVAQLLHLSVRTIERYIEEASIPYTELPRRGARGSVRFLRSELLKWLHHRTIKPVRWKGQGESG
jgi:excisionase family DNA binding protein